jgi:hypothetical protein
MQRIGGDACTQLDSGVYVWFTVALALKIVNRFLPPGGMALSTLSLQLRHSVSALTMRTFVRSYMHASQKRLTAFIKRSAVVDATGEAAYRSQYLQARISL